nr:hypothetical protein GCM10020093_069640 [Planobispora longispora]
MAVRTLGSVKAIRYHAYGPPEVLRLEDADMPAVGAGDVLIRVRAASVNPLDWHHMRGEPYFARLDMGLTRPKHTALGADLAGVVESAGRDVTAFRPGTRCTAAAAWTSCRARRAWPSTPACARTACCARCRPG